MKTKFYLFINFYFLFHLLTLKNVSILMCCVGMKVNNETESPNKVKTTITFQSNEAYKVRIYSLYY